MSVLRRNPGQRRLLYVLDSATYARLGGRELVDLQQGHTLQVVNLEELHDARDDVVAQRLAGSPFMAAGAVLVQNPFRHDVYLDAASAQRDVALEKAQLLSRVCQFLGARSVHFEELDIERSDGSRSVAADLTAGAVKGKGTASQRQAELRDDLLRLNDTYGGSQPDVEGAKRLLAEHHLSHEAGLLHLVASVEHNNNPLKEHAVLMSVNREVIASLEVVAELGSRVPAAAKLAAKYSHASKEVRELKATYKIKF